MRRLKLGEPGVGKDEIWRSTRAKRPFVPADIDLVEKTLGAELACKALWPNSLALYRMSAP